MTQRFTLCLRYIIYEQQLYDYKLYIILYIIYRIFLRKVVKTVKKTALSQHFMFYDKSCSLIRYSLVKS